MTSINVALIEPVGSHGGMDYYDSGLCGGLLENNVPVIWYTCDRSSVRGDKEVPIKHSFVNIWGESSAVLRGIRYVKGLVTSLVHARLNGANVAHFHFFHVGALEFLGVLFSRILLLEPVVTVHDVESFRDELTSKFLLRVTYSMTAHFIVHNKVSHKELSSKFNVPFSKISIVPHGSYIGLMKGKEDKALARKKLDIDPDEKVILFFGQIKEVKGLDLLLQAFGRSHQRMGKVRLVIAGKVWKDNFSKYEQLIYDHAIEKNCSLHIRYIPDDELSTFYSMADLIVLPYRKIYQSGVLLMAMSFGVPVLTSNLSGMTEIVNDGVNGYTFESGDVGDLAEKLIYVLSKLDQTSVVKNAELDMLTRFSWTTIAKNTISVYARVLEK